VEEEFLINNMKMNLETLPKGLKLERGLSTELATERLADAKIPFELYWEFRNKGNYFRQSTILVDENQKENVLSALGKPNRTHMRFAFYVGEYTPESNFDWGQISGELTMNEGRLVESVRIFYKRIDL